MQLLVNSSRALISNGVITLLIFENYTPKLLD